MNKSLFAALALVAAAPAFAADVGVSVSISQPGVYGRIDIGRFPQPQVVVAQPVIIQRPVVVQQPQVVYAQPEPVYMWVPPGHRKNWRKHCAAYNACGVPVYFVQDQWYNQNVHPRGGDRDEDRRGGEREHGRGEGRGEGHGRGHDRRD